MNGVARLIASVLVVLFVARCQGGDATTPLVAAPEVVIPPGVLSSQTADQVARKMLDEIKANESRLGRALAPARIIRIQLLRKGEMYPMAHFDGTNPETSFMGPDGGPGWMVEAVGTFLGFDRQSGQLVAIGTHGFHEWDDAGGEGMGFNACWRLHPGPVADLDGVCR